MNLLNTNQAAERLGVSVRRVRALISEGTLRAHQLGREYAIEESALADVKVYGKPGRPAKQPLENGSTSTSETKKPKRKPAKAKKTEAKKARKKGSGQ
ncbi:MAG: helix-turn-helix domain-containing protein [Acidobacteriota bacterium]|nr:helix-turn-helix domain-containing protein [Acidobacteriota bacterium]